MASVFSQAGFRTIGIDQDPERVAECRHLRSVSLSGGFGLPAAVNEPYVDLSSNRLVFEDRPCGADVSFIIVPTPSTSDGSFSSLYVEQAIADIIEANTHRSTPHTIVIVSTVSPGTCDRLRQQHAKERFALVYNPTFIAIGSVVHDLMDPNLLLLGGSGEAIDPVKDIWIRVIKQGPSGNLTVHMAPYVEIELLKLSVNAVLGVKIALANSLGKLFEAYGVNQNAVGIMTADPRIGDGYFTPGGPISGPCLPRDNTALLRAARAKNVNLPLSAVTNDIDLDLRRQVLYKVLWPIIPKTVGIFGMSYKYGLDVTEGSMGEWLVDQISYIKGVSAYCYDDFVHPCDFLGDVLGSEVVVVTQPEYETILSKNATEAKVIRLWH